MDLKWIHFSKRLKKKSSLIFTGAFCSMDGILIINKPEKITSAGVVSRLKKILDIKKIGHTGTLDPMATGVLVCCINRGTKLARFFLTGTKKYEAELKLGVETDTQDMTGKVISESDVTLFSHEKLKSVFKKFKGNIKQIPPAYSALKHNGIPLYKFARKGEFIQKPPRDVCISRLCITNIQLPKISFEVDCSSGTYIRTICFDIGRELGCGAHLVKLKRTESCGFSINDAITLEEVKKISLQGDLQKKSISLSDALPFMDEYIASNALTEKIRHGIVLTKQDGIISSCKTEGFIKILNKEKNLIAIVHDNEKHGIFKYYGVFHY